MGLMGIWPAERHVHVRSTGPIHLCCFPASHGENVSYSFAPSGLAGHCRPRGGLETDTGLSDNFPPRGPGCGDANSKIRSGTQWNNEGRRAVESRKG